MTHHNPNHHSARPVPRRNHSRNTVSDIRPRARSTSSYQPRARGMLPGTDQEYMISLGSRASRRDEQHNIDNAPSLIEAFLAKAKEFGLFLLQQRRRLAPGLLIGILLFSVAIIATNQSQDAAVANQDLNQILKNNGDTPHDNKPYAQGNYAVAPDLPRTLSVQKIGAFARVVRLGVREDSEPKYPQNIYDVGWYENSAKPGEAGAALLIGHIQGEEKQGVFHDLANLVPGDEFQLEMGDETMKNFYIVKMEAYPRNNVDYSALTSSALEGKPGLNLLTAVGAFESNSDVTQQLGIFAIEKTSFLEDVN